MVRSFKTPYTRPQLGAYFKGVMQYHYRDVMCNKSPLDIALFLHLIHAAKPATYIEIGPADARHCQDVRHGHEDRHH
jgi:cephalosporin hydroxylase